MDKNIKVGLAFPAFFGSFKEIFPELELIGSKDPKSFDLILFSGGEDISPRFYGQPLTYSVGINPYRDDVENNILREVYNSQVKILGVCRGHQLINVVLGGVLVQDIKLCLGENHSYSHPITVTKDNSLIGKCFNHVNSLHHQGVVNVGSKINVTAIHGRIVEATESKQIITTQFHPEFMVGKEPEEFFKLIRLWVTDYEKLVKMIKESNKKAAEEIKEFTPLKLKKKTIIEDLVREDRERLGSIPRAGYSFSTTINDSSTFNTSTEPAAQNYNYNPTWVEPPPEDLEGEEF